MQSKITDFSNSNKISQRILSMDVLDGIFIKYFGKDYYYYQQEDDAELQRAGVDVWVHTSRGRFGVDLKGCSSSVRDALHLEVYSVREDRKIGYLLNGNRRNHFVLFVSGDQEWRMFRHSTLAQALRLNFRNWADKCGVRIQRTRCAWRHEGSYSSSTICVPTSWIRGAYYAIAAS